MRSRRLALAILIAGCTRGSVRSSLDTPDVVFSVSDTCDPPEAAASSTVDIACPARVRRAETPHPVPTLRQDIVLAMTGRHAEVIACNRGHGTVQATFAVDANGSVTAVRAIEQGCARDDIPWDERGRCIAEALCDVVLPPSEIGGFAFAYPFRT